MFYGCTSLVNAPSLPATTLSTNCYSYMFYDCRKLSYIKALFLTDIRYGSFTQNWVTNVSEEGTFVKNKDATWDLVGINGVPKNWTIEYE